MIDLYERFGLAADLETEISRFRVKFDNLLASSRFGSELLDDKEDDITWRFANTYGKRYTHPYDTDDKAKFMFSSALPLNEFLLRIQVLLDLLWTSRPVMSQRLASIIDDYFEESALDLGYFVKVYKTKSPQVLPAKSKTHKKKIANTLALLEARPQKYKAVMEHYESGIKELLSAKTKAQFKDVIEDMSTACDSLIKALFNDENLGFKHLFKNDRWKEARLNDSERRIFGDLNNLIDQIKHDVIKSYTRDNVETIVYLVSTFMEKIAK